MIPQKLSLTNFMCYREVALDFAGIHVACLAGENGAGKSALLDAITWALWGNSRLGARGDDDLIRLGEDEMAVEFAFQLGDEAYRVLRKRKAGKRSRSLLDFQIRDGGRWRSLSEGGIRDTQEKIEKILRLDYDTFVNSAFLRQGQADEFTVKTASQRKRVLSDILGLDRWSAYEERVKEHQRAIEAEAEAVRLRLEEIEAELARRSEYEAQLKEARTAVEALDTALQEAQRAYQQIESVRAELRHKQAQLAEQERRIDQAQRELAELAEDRAAREERLAQCEHLLVQAEEIRAGYEAYQWAMEEERALGAKLRESVALNERSVALEAQISEARHRLETEREVIERRIAELEGRLPSDGLLAEHKEVQAQLEHLTQLAESREAARDDLARIAEERAGLRAHNEALRQEMEALKEKLTLLEQAANGSTDDTSAVDPSARAQCPLCEQSLTEEHRQRVADRVEADGKARGDAYRANRARVKQLGEQAQALEGQIADSERLLQERAALQRREAALNERIEQGRRAAGELEEVREEMTALERRLAEGDYAQDVRVELQEVLAQAKELGYDAEAHDAARRAVSENQIFAERKAQLETAQERREEEREALDRLREAEQRWQEQVDQAQARKAELENEADELRGQLENAEAVEAKLQRVREEAAEAHRMLGAAQQRLAACEAYEGQRADKLRRKQELAEEAGIYDELRTAFGVRGVPAMIIEAAVPEIEDEANQLLTQMTAGRMHVRFDTQRETKAGEVREALEIKIADELGTRPYENYSGGEQFRVNFAIRIALSKLLARRAGAQLQTLVIDEGFGTQDAQGRQRLVEAINAIQDDFARVLVITHIDELKDAFPVRIEVTKTPMGSLVEVV